MQNEIKNLKPIAHNLGVRMNIKYWFAVIIVIVIFRTEYAQTYESLEQKSADILLQLSLKDSSAYTTIEELSDFLKKNNS